MIRRFALHLALAFVATATAVSSSQADDPWYRDYFSMVTMPHGQSDEALEEVGADAFRSSTLYGGWYGAWWGERQREKGFHKASSARNSKFFGRHVMYYDGGEVGDFAVFLDPQGKIRFDGWSVHTWEGAPPLTARWFGIDSFFKKDNPFPYSNYLDYGLSLFTYPDGTIADPVYEVLGRRSVEGALDWNEPFCNLEITDEQAEESGLAAISKKQFAGEHVVGRNGWITCRQMTQDYTNPQLRDYQVWEIGHLTRTVKPDGFHIDNFGDNNLYRPFQMGFGVWSEHTFKEYMKREFTPEQLRDMGIADIETFDIKAYLRERKKPGAPNIFDAYNEPKWKDDLIFKCYLVNHAIESANFHKPKHDAVKRAAAEVGIDCMVSGNAIPLFPGFTLINGHLDVAHFEWQTVREYQPNRRVMGLPPKARSGYITRLATALGRENYSVVSLYVPHDLRGGEHENLYLAQGFEALSNRSIIDFGHQYLDMFSPGSPRTAGIFNRFLDRHRRELTRRDFVVDAAVVYDQWAEIASSTACQLDVNDFFNEYAGWCDFMQDTHRQWNVLLSSELTAKSLAGTPMVILPSTLSLTDANYEALEAYLKSGGRVLATGLTGLRHGPVGHLMKRDANPLERFKQYPGFRWIPQQPAAKYWLSKDAAAGNRMASLVTWPDLRRTLETDAEIHVGVTLSRSLPGEPDSLSLDLNNNNFDPKSDTFTPTKPFTVNIHLPDGFTPAAEATVAEPEKEPATLPVTINGRTATLQIPSFEIYQFITLPAHSTGR